MSRFLGRNDLNVANLFYERVNYSVNAYRKDGNSLYLKPVNNFLFAERMMYGRIDKNHSVIAVNEAFLKDIDSKNSSKKQISSLDFVADAFAGLVSEIKRQGLFGKLDNQDPFLFELKAYNSFNSSKVMYLNYINILKEIFFNSYLNKELNEQIIDLRSFIPIFCDFLLVAAETVPVTKSSFISSNLCSPLVSGLTIDLTDLDVSDDKLKEAVLDSQNFPFFVEAAKKYGFFIDKNIPWRITADIGSTKMLEFASSYGVNSETAILRKYFQKVGGNDIFDLQSMAMTFYNELVFRKKTLRLYDGPKLTIVCRERATIDDLLNDYSARFWIDKYIDLVYIEKRKPGSIGIVTQLKKTCGSLLDKMSIKFVLSYIEQAFRGFDNFEGSFAKISLQQTNLNKDKDFKPKY